MYTLLSILISGTVLGSLYSLMAAGLSLVWGTVGIFNFSHGSMIMLGAYIAWNLHLVGVPLLFALVIVIVFTFFIGVILEKVLIERFYSKSEAGLVTVITTLAGMLIIDHFSLIIWGPRLKSLPVFVKGIVRIFDLTLSIQELIIILLAPIILILFSFFLKKTKTGLAIRAVEQNLDFSLLLGINVNNIYIITFGIAAILAGVAGVLLGSIRFLTPFMGGEYLLKAFVIVILGGFGSMHGTLLAGYILGLVEAASQYYLGMYWTPFFVFSILIFILIYRPTGFFGEEQ